MYDEFQHTVILEAPIHIMEFRDRCIRAQVQIKEEREQLRDQIARMHQNRNILERWIFRSEPGHHIFMTRYHQSDMYDAMDEIAGLCKIPPRLVISLEVWNFAYRVTAGLTWSMTAGLSLSPTQHKEI